METQDNPARYPLYISVLLLLTWGVLICAMVPKKTRIIEGQASMIGRPMFVASVMVNSFHKCGGSIISHRFVLTAAHCCMGRIGLEDPNLVAVSIGNVYWRNGKVHNISKLLVHEEYDKPTTRNDVALLKTKQQIHLGHGVGLIRLHPRRINDAMETKAMVFGWGFYDDGNGKLIRRVAEVLYQAEIYTVLQNKCQNYYRKVTPNNICMTNGNRRGSCNGDSGGPLCMEIDKNLYQVGIVSFGGECNNTKPEVYTRISSFYDWIKDTMRNNAAP